MHILGWFGLILCILVYMALGGAVVYIVERISPLPNMYPTLKQRTFYIFIYWLWPLTVFYFILAWIPELFRGMAER